MTDFKAIKEACDMAEIINRYTSLKKDGPHYKGCCPFHDEDTASLVVTPGRKGGTWKCFGCGKYGDIFDFIQGYGYSKDEAAEIVKNQSGIVGVDAIAVKSNKPVFRKEWKQAIPDRWPSNIKHPRYGEPAMVWPWRNKDGIIVSYDCRFERIGDSGKLEKDVLPLTFVSDSNGSEWRWIAMDEPRMLANRDLLEQDPSRNVVIVEGRKAMEAAEKLLKKPIITTWQGGGKAVGKVDWEPLKGRTVIIWQDHDYAGYETTLHITELIKDGVNKIRYVHNPIDKPKGWDAWDAMQDGWTDADTPRYINSNAFDRPQVIINPKANTHDANTGVPEQTAVEVAIEVQHPTAAVEVQAPAKEVAASPSPVVAQKQGGRGSKRNNPFIQTIPKNPYFSFLGFLVNDGKLSHCFYNNITKTVIKMSASSMGKASNLLDLAPLNYWEEEFVKKDGFDHGAAVNFLVSTSNRVGIFMPSNIRGRGAWMDGDDVVVHSGDYLIINGKDAELGDRKGRYIYEQGAPLDFDPSNPLTTKEASLFLDIAKEIRWEREVNAYLMAGWCVVAPICGALSWRPHIWITGPAGSGKTWVLQKIIKPLLGGVGLFVQGATSEAGLRQRLRRDALPVVFDEAEGENRNEQERMQQVLTLMRSASAEDGGDIIKGSTAGIADGYQIRSCFAFASIMMQLAQQSDRTRVTTLTVRAAGDTDEQKKEAAEHFQLLAAKQYTVITEEYTQRLQARTVKLLPVILANAATFSAAATAVLGQQRAGDQLGALLAGAYSLVSDKEIPYEQAVSWVRIRDWSEEQQLTETRDERNLFSYLMSYTVKVEGAYASYDRTVAELIQLLTGQDTDSHVANPASEIRLARMGIKIVKDGNLQRIFISNQSEEIKRMLRDTPWALNYSAMLLRIPGAKKEKPTKFISMTQRAVSIPMEYFMD